MTSGGHINPAVTVAKFVSGHFPLREATKYYAFCKRIVLLKYENFHSPQESLLVHIFPDHWGVYKFMSGLSCLYRYGEKRENGGRIRHVSER